MPPAPVEALPLVGAVPHDLSIIGLFLQSDAVVKVVMLILLIASFWSWAVIFDKVMRLRRLRYSASSFEESFWSGGSLDDLYERNDRAHLEIINALRGRFEGAKLREMVVEWFHQ